MKTEEILAEFERRRQRRSLASWTMVAAVLGLPALAGVLNERLVVALGAGVLVGGAAVIWKTWRCPVCEGRLGRSFSYTYCPHCGSRLQP